ncbi:hypothetical protein GLA29479_1968 [Lysobacter antibioticus]|uniref:Uncharacterized protein n=1 Tax=Lysobacter antibioticus TaxID=84531 RepID=A0A0S2F798_LYSAN|nr:hypothetical protein GLA29479_1968 [Lysobacter antibioticus]ALN79392.1 hypothetical protein LA76x_1233 [Lysobacter antibioticus]
MYSQGSFVKEGLFFGYLSFGPAKESNPAALADGSFALA